MATSSDRKILNSILNPLLPLGECVYDDENVPEVEDETQEEKETTEIKEAKELEKEGIKAAESGELQKSIDIFTKSIEMAPKRASCYNNRAQALRLKGDVTGALEDLNNAINLSEGTGKAACQAFCQRGLIYQLQGKKVQASDDYRVASKLGSAFAKTMLVQMNPYAALCNQMLAEVMQKLQRRNTADENAPFQ